MKTTNTKVKPKAKRQPIPPDKKMLVVTIDRKVYDELVHVAKQYAYCYQHRFNSWATYFNQFVADIFTEDWSNRLDEIEY